MRDPSCGAAADRLGVASVLVRLGAAVREKAATNDRERKQMLGLSPQQVAQFQADGYLVVKGLFDPAADLDPVIAEYAGVLDRLADSLFESGQISSRHVELSFSQKLIKIQQETGNNFTQHFDFSLPQSNIKSDTPIWLGEAVFNILRNERLLDAVELIVGPEIYANPVQHVRLKMPESAIPENMSGNVRTTPWHQDNAVVTVAPCVRPEMSSRPKNA